MQCSNTAWDDTPNHRTIEMQVKWQITNQGISIQEVIPTRVIIRQDGGSEKMIGVHTAAGRRILGRSIDRTAILADIANQESAGV